MGNLLTISAEVRGRRLQEAARNKGHQMELETDPGRGLARALEEDFNIVIIPLNWPAISDGGAGLKLVEKIHSIKPFVPIIVITDGPAGEAIIPAISAGAFDHVAWPTNHIEWDCLLDVIERAVCASESPRPTPSPPKGHPYSKDFLVGNSQAMMSLFKEIGRVARKSLTVLIQGETGTGKERVAKAIHDYSDRANGPFVIVNCAAIPDDLIESELFGYEKGAFTGAENDKTGKFEEANGGTIFLDEIGELGLKLQQRLLRVLQEKTIDRIGATKPIKLNVRIIAATNRDLNTAVTKGEFRDDLRFRLSTAITLPPLRERSEDIPDLVRFFVEQEGAELCGTIPRISPEAMDFFQRQPWKGNVRELNNAVRNALLQANGLGVTLQIAEKAVAKGSGDSPLRGFEEALSRYVSELILRAQNGEVGDLRELLGYQVDRELLRQGHAATGQNIGATGALLGLSYPTAKDKLKRHGLLRPKL